MALLKTVPTTDGNALTYHRIDRMRFALPDQPVLFTLESYYSREDRERPGAFKVVRDYNAMVDSPAEAVAQSYAALLLMPEWADATSDEPTPDAVAVAVVAGTKNWDAENSEWVDVDTAPTLQQLVEAAQADINAAAGLKRAALMPPPATIGIEMTLYAKWKEAKAWVSAGYTGAAPPFVQAEADAMGYSTTQAANAQAALGDYLFGSRFPAIEACRVKGNDAVTRHSTAEGIQAALDAALAELEAL